MFESKKREHNRLLQNARNRRYYQKHHSKKARETALKQAEYQAKTEKRNDQINTLLLSIAQLTAEMQKEHKEKEINLL